MRPPYAISNDFDGYRRVSGAIASARVKGNSLKDDCSRNPNLEEPLPQIRNKIVHGAEDIDCTCTLRTVDLGQCRDLEHTYGYSIWPQLNVRFGQQSTRRKGKNNKQINLRTVNI